MPKRPFYTVGNLKCRRSLGYLIRRLHNLIVPEAEAQFAAAELSFTQWVTLMGLREGIADTCAELARHLGHDTGATTRLLDQMELRGLVKRARSTSDRRVVHIDLTARGEATSKRLAPRMVQFWNEKLDGFSHAEIETLVSLLTRLLARLENDVETPAARARTVR